MTHKVGQALATGNTVVLKPAPDTPFNATRLGRLVAEETFGPVLVVIPYEDDDDAVRIANDSEYGLAGFVLSDSLERSMAVARRIRAGTVGLNGGAAYGASVTFGGYKASGIGRQNGTAGFDQHTEVKSVAWPTS